MSIKKKNANHVHKDQTCFIFCDKDVPTNGLIYKIGSAFEDQSERIKILPMLKKKLDLKISISSKGFEINIRNSEKLWIKELIIEDAQKHSLKDTDIINNFSEFNENKFRAGKMNVYIKGELFLPSSILKKIRKEFWQWVSSNINENDIFTVNTPEKFEKEYNAISKYSGNISKYKTSYYVSENKIKKQGLLVNNIYNLNPGTDEIILPVFCSEYKLNDLEKKIDECYHKGIRKFRITSLYQLELLKNYKDIELSTSYPLPVINSMSVLLFKNQGIKKIQAWIELEKQGIVALLEKSVLPIEIYHYGRPSILSTRAKILIKGAIKDNRGIGFIVKYDKISELTNIYPEKVLQIPKIKNTIDFIDLTHVEPDNPNTTSFNFNHELV